ELPFFFPEHVLDVSPAELIQVVEADVSVAGPVGMLLSNLLHDGGTYLVGGSCQLRGDVAVANLAFDGRFVVLGQGMSLREMSSARVWELKENRAPNGSRFSFRRFFLRTFHKRPNLLSFLNTRDRCRGALRVSQSTVLQRKRPMASVDVGELR